MTSRCSPETSWRVTLSSAPSTQSRLHWRRTAHAESEAPNVVTSSARWSRKPRPPSAHLDRRPMAGIATHAGTARRSGACALHPPERIRQDLSIDVADDGTLNELTLAVGNSVLYGPQGEVLSRNPGQGRFLFVFDPQTFEVLSVQTVKGSTGRTDDTWSRSGVLRRLSRPGEIRPRSLRRIDGRSAVWEGRVSAEELEEPLEAPE